jgi:hypothetical protein
MLNNLKIAKAENSELKEKIEIASKLSQLNN